MKTITIFDAMEKAETQNYYLSEATYYYPNLETKHRRRTRQKNKYRAALLARIEAGDRARATLDKMINVEWADDESVADMFFKLDKILDNYVNGEEEPRP